DLTGLREFAESTIFELTNATNADKFKTLETGLIQGAAIRAYGREKARLEAQASWSVSQILQQRSGYQPSKWGLAQIAACAPYSDVAGFGAAFQSQAHDSKAGKSAASLPSDQYYAFNGAYTIGGTKGAFDQQFKSLTLGGKVLTLEKVKSNVKQSSSLNRMNMLSVTFYHVVLDLLKSPPSGMKLAYTWRGTPTDRDFSDGMKAIAADTGDALKNEVIRALPKACV
ncbi:MAG TPA: hypothetical protein VG963_10740, partial [Polyangiaceae bacterium]|nr:hypothetical protein [Polyangiaceae bacterium]